MRPPEIDLEVEKLRILSVNRLADMLKIQEKRWLDSRSGGS